VRSHAAGRGFDLGRRVAEGTRASITIVKAARLADLDHHARRLREAGAAQARLASDLEVPGSDAGSVRREGLQLFLEQGVAVLRRSFSSKRSEIARPSVGVGRTSEVAGRCVRCISSSVSRSLDRNGSWPASISKKS
jgi:hypothetical protein